MLLVCCKCLFPPFESCLLGFSCSKIQLLLEFLFFILTFQKKALSLHPQRIQYSRISSLSLESVVVYPTISAQGYTWRPVSLGLSRRRAHLSARKGGPFFSPPSLKPSETIWNHLELFGTIWNGLRPLGPPAGLFCIVCWQEILSPSSILRSAPSGPPQASGPLFGAQGLLESAVFATAATAAAGVRAERQGGINYYL